MIILGIETSCDETAASVVEAGGPADRPVFKLLGSALVSQAKLHEKYGGVYPNLAKREHIKNLPYVLAMALEEAKIEIKDIDKIAVTVGPGLEPALWAGINFAKELGEKWRVPVIPTNHMEGHIASVLLGNSKMKQIFYPAIALLISGGHTELVYLKSWKEKKIVGETRDDAVGEAFDKVARMLGLPYPGGPEISALAEKARNSKIKTQNIKLPRPMIRSGDLNFSFSGLKTAVLYYLRNLENSSQVQVLKTPSQAGEPRREISQQGNIRGPEKLAPRKSFLTEKIKMAVAREFEDVVAEVLVSKSRQAIRKFRPKTFIVSGGVIANKKIRESFGKLLEEFDDLTLKIPDVNLATDNATMIALAGYLSYLAKTYSKIELKAEGNLKYA